MTLFDKPRNYIRLLYYFGQNWITLLGAALTTGSALTMLIFWVYELLLAGPFHPYVGILLFLFLPGLLIVGLLIIPVGILLRRRQLRSRGEIPSVYPQIDFRAPGMRHAVLFVAVATLVNIFIISVAGYKSVNYMDSTAFCGRTCHTVMMPEYTAFQDSPHSRLSCVDCHIGPGAGWFVRSKLSGVRRVFAVTFHTYSTPIPSPVKYLRPARETCGQCHWPQLFSGDKFIVETTFKDDEQNTRLTTVLVMKIGGHTWKGPEGIHGRHLADASRIRYIAIDPYRQTIPVVYYTDDQGKTSEYVSTDVKATKAQLDAGEHRTMDCVDCHNRPSHTFELPGNAVSKDMANGLISPELPYIRKKAEEVLKAGYPDRETAQQRIIEQLNEFYRTNYPNVYNSRRALIAQSSQAVANIYLRNIFPAMKVDWGVHPNNLGHTDYPGCFRCHDGSHTNAQGETITNDCSACHNLVAVEEQNPKILADLGLSKQ
ncbi:MAG TPA: NapC/NirT family cytochrome c [Candidatus Methylomirabilis sp.]|nr:NapC/NirT family cytochrome c [Candidatus Methylomirabilis sp.]